MAERKSQVHKNARPQVTASLQEPAKKQCAEAEVVPQSPRITVAVIGSVIVQRTNVPALEIVGSVKVHYN